jgi:hypothetical protein
MMRTITMRKTFQASGTLLALLLFGGAGVLAQEPAAVSPAGALRDALSAACSQDQRGFAGALTARNARSFLHLNASARVALMKRLVLLDEPGKPVVSANAAGRPVVRCETPAETTEMQIGGADAQENLAFLPLEIRAVSDAAGANARQIQIGMVREAGDWKLLSVGLLILDLPSLEIEWDRASIAENERDTLATLKELAQAIESYRRTYLRLPESLASLAHPATSAASADSAGLVDAELASGVKDGYTYRYVIQGASAVGAPARYELAVTPRVYGTTGRRSFYRDIAGVIHAADHLGALGGPGDPRIE